MGKRLGGEKGKRPVEVTRVKGSKKFREKMGEFGVSGVWRVDWIEWLGFRKIGRGFGRGVDWLRVRYEI